MMLGRLPLIGVVALAAMMCGPGIALAEVQAGHLNPVAGPVVADNLSKSYNWAGYATQPGTDTVSKVSAKWTVPAIECTSKHPMASFWIGIDGFSTPNAASNTVEQIGTIAQCSGSTPTYFSWYEMYPAQSSIQTLGTVSPGDDISATVSYDSMTALFTVSMKDTTSEASWREVSANPGSRDMSAEWIVERPSGSTDPGGFYPLSDFGTFTFSSCKATISGVTGGISSFPPVYVITMVNYKSGDRTLASPSALTSGDKFVITWDHPD